MIKAPAMQMPGVEMRVPATRLGDKWVAKTEPFDVIVSADTKREALGAPHFTAMRPPLSKYVRLPGANERYAAICSN